MGIATRDAMRRDVEWLENGWRWLAANQDDPQFTQMEDAWLERLHRYEQVYALVFLRPTRSVAVMSSTTPITLKSSVLAVRAGLAALTNAQDDNQRRYLGGLLAQDATTLADQCLARNVWLNAAYDWLEQHQDADDMEAREAQWLLKLRQYETAMDLLGQTLEALKAIPGSAPQPNPSSGTAPHTQEAFL